MSDNSGTPEAWHADPTGRFEYRWWDGTAWTASVSTGGVAQNDPLQASADAEQQGSAQSPTNNQSLSGNAAQTGSQLPGSAALSPEMPGQLPGSAALSPEMPGQLPGSAALSPEMPGQLPGSAAPPPPGQADQTGYVPAGNVPGAKIQAQAAKAVSRSPGGASNPATAGYDLLNEPVLVVNQKAKLIEIKNEYAIYNGAGNQIGGVRQVGQSTFKKILRVLGDIDQYLTHKLEVVDVNGRTLLNIKRPAKFFKSKFEITGPTGGDVGQIIQKNMIGKISFALMAGGQQIGSINAENWRAWNFSIRDHNENEVARISKTWEGLAKTMFTSADNYVVQIHSPLNEPLRSMVVAAALSIDTALKQDKRGFN